MIRAAVIGLGWWGKHIVRRTKGSEVLHIVTAVETNPAHREFANEQGIDFVSNIQDVLRDPQIQAVIICTPHSTHTRLVLAASAAGKHVFCEKPLALTCADAELSVEACRKAGVVLGIGHERRFERAIVEVRRLIKEGTFGTIMHAEANFSHDKLANVPAGDWRTSSKDAPAAGMTAMGIHLTDLYLDLLGPVTEVFAATTSRVAYPETGDVISAHLRFSSGATAYFNAILVTPHYLRLVVFGSQAWVEIINQTHPDTPGPTSLVLQHRDGRRDKREYEWTDTVRTNLELFAQAAEGKAAYPFTDQQKVGNIATLEAICRSVAENIPVAVKSI